jgi:hypothetical protein
VHRVTSSLITTTTHDGSPQDDANRPILWLGPHDNACEPNADNRRQDDEGSQLPGTGLPNADASLPPNGEPYDKKYQPTVNEVTLNNDAASTLGWERP